MTAHDVTPRGVTVPSPREPEASSERSLAHDGLDLADLAREMAELQGPTPPSRRRVTPRRPHTKRSQGPHSRLLTVLRLSTDYLTPALMILAAAVWLAVLLRTADHLA